MKFVYLILYLWHASNEGMNSAAGGPSLVVTPMPSLAVCEKAGSTAKDFADKKRRRDTWPHVDLWQGWAASFVCIEVDDKPTPTPPKCSP